MNNVKNFGKMSEIINKVDFVNKVILSGNKDKVTELEVELDNELGKLGVFSPKKQALVAHLYSSGKKDDSRLEELESIRKNCGEIFENGLKKEITEYITRVIGENKRLFLVKRKKKSGNNWIDMSYLPMGTDMFDNPFGKKTCTSVCGVRVTEDMDELTEQKLVKISFLSICYDSIDRQYKPHLWVLTYKVEEKRVTEEMVAEAESELNSIEEMF